MARAMWKGVVIAESDDLESADGNLDFPPESLKMEHFKPSATTTSCFWKGQASYYTIVVDGEENPDAAWVYREPKAKAAHLAGRVAFWKGVSVER